MKPPAPAGTDAHTRDVLRRLELDVTRRLDGLLQGDYRGLVSGLGSEAGEARAYVAGDDVRRMDWNVTARTGTAHVRDTIADRELATTVLVDQSPSLDFGTAVRTKRELALSAVAAIGLLTARTGNRFSAMIADGATITELQAGSGRRNLMSVLHRLATADLDQNRGRQPEGSLGTGLHRLAGPGHRGGLAVVISDLLTPDWEQPLKQVTLRHETLVIEVVDQRELELPNVGVIELRDQATGAVREIDTRSAKLRQRYADAGTQRLADHAAAVRRAGADHLVLHTDRDWIVDLARFVDRRRRGHRATRRTNR